MGDVVALSRHARASAGAGYKSGRNSWRGTPEIRSTAKTRRGGTSSHCETACKVTPSDRARRETPPAAAFARSKASFELAMPNSSMALVESQGLLHCGAQAPLYHAVMTLGQRIKAARKRLRPQIRQRDLADEFGISEQAVSGWERDEGFPDFNKLPQLRRILRVTYSWLLEGEGPPPAADAPEVLADDIAPAMQKRRANVA